MLPGVYDFQWDVGHLAFLGAFFLVVGAIGLVVTLSVLKSLRNLRAREAEAIRWAEDFGDIPRVARRCRHDLTGRTTARVCDNGFDCRTCDFHTAMLAAGRGAECAEKLAVGETPGRHGAADAVARADAETFGFEMPGDRLYHRGHTWVQLQDDGTVRVGLDDFGSRLIGKPDKVALPAKGSHVQTNGTGWRLRKGNAEVRVLSPVEGTVLGTGGPDEGWYLAVKPREEQPDLTHLLRGAEVRGWMLHEVERLQALFSSQALGHSLADGGQPIGDLSVAEPDLGWDRVWGEVFLDT